MIGVSMRVTPLAIPSFFVTTIEPLPIIYRGHAHVQPGEWLLGKDLYHRAMIGSVFLHIVALCFPLIT